MGRPPNPWAWVPWEYAPEGGFNGRWDDPEAEFRTTYAGASLLACLLEVLSFFRPDDTLAAELAEIETDEHESRSSPPPGAVPLSWLGTRVAASARLTGEFCVVSDSETIGTLRPVFLPTARRLHLHDFDAAALRDGQCRELTQEVAGHLYRHTSVSGIEFASRHGDDHRLWAVFERKTGQDSAPELTGQRTRQLGREDPALVEAFRIHRLTWEEPSVELPQKPLPLMAAEDDEAVQALFRIFGDRGPTTQTPLGAAYLFWSALRDPVGNRPQLDHLANSPDDWGDYAAAAQLLVPLGIAENVIDDPSDASLKWVKLIPVAGNVSAVAFEGTQLTDVVLLGVVRTDGPPSGWKVLGIDARGLFSTDTGATT